jgi:P27 family predicted phage terminase small subunit
MPNKAKSNERKRLEGTYRADRDKTLRAVPDGDAPLRCPAHLDTVARREWRRVTAEGSFNATDRAGLVAYCVAYSNWLAAQAIVQREGQTIGEPIVNRSTGNVTGHRVKRHPASVVAKDERAAMLQAAQRLGLFANVEAENDGV